MKNNDLVFKHSSLETTMDVKDTLKWKMESIRDQNLPIDTSLADYIAFSVDNLEAQKAQLKAVKVELSQREKALNDQIDNIKEDGAAFLLENGLNRLDGLICSSITVSKEKESSIRTTEKKEFVINITQAELEELLIALGKAEIKTVITEKKSNYIPAKLKINKRKIALSEVINV